MRVRRWLPSNFFVLDGTGRRNPVPNLNDESTPVVSTKQHQRRFRPILESAWVSVRGTHHERNQDAVLAAQPLFAVADGVGGGSAGELASSKLLEYCRSIPHNAWRGSKSLSAAMVQADQALGQSLREVAPGPSATTFAGVWLRRTGRGLLAHIGDARIIRITPGRIGSEITQLTQDQTYGNLGEVPPPGGSADDPARMAGIGAAGDPPVQLVCLGETELLLLCTDGLHRFVSASQLGRLCHAELQKDQPLIILAQKLAQAAQQAGSHDDISVLLVRRNPWLGVRWPVWIAFILALCLALARSAPAMPGLSALWQQVFGGIL